MPSPLRRQHASVIAQLLDAPQRFACCQALRLLLGWLQAHGVPPGDALARLIRFDNSVSMAFPAGQIESLSAESLSAAGLHDAQELLQALLSSNPPQLHLTPTFMGFLGVHGSLPSHYSERIAGEADAGARAFLDLFSSRAVTLFYQAWEKYRIEHAPVGTTLLPCLLALAGTSHEAIGVPADLIGLYSGLLQQSNVSSLVMARILTEHFGVPIHITENTGGMEALAPREQTALGGKHAVLNQHAMLGERSYRPDLAVRVRIGPLSAARHASFLPGGAASAQLQAMLRLFGQPLLRYDITLVLRASDVHGVTLGDAQAGLGCDSFLGHCEPGEDRDDMRYSMHLMDSFDA
ncbi:type VI secretion system baseplate subunit TssG [Janthinobacterium sp. PC23-8]|uniref:type VI secretion system baseplate subunit TssG n=1 Tax=Janthinobacterium sp. PC23-8 TaxID=2012679 RepID=UPI000B966509|nr:type VI secretion system baseplate subunit TssG [Janthinobacterium sp. PC23-8]OYO26548.1 hypothetical protein CD932_25380 [Janthinobacterium sp. PC23-8]